MQKLNTTTKSNQYNQIVILDFDGVLGDTLQDMLRFSDEVAERMGYPHHTTLQDLEALQPMSFANLGRQIGIPEELIPTYVNSMVEKFENSEIPCPIFPGMAEAVLDLAQDSYLAIVSGNTTQVIQNFLGYYRLAEVVKKIYGVDIPGSKREKIETILSQVPDRGKAVFMVGDAASDIEAAHQAGIIGVAVAWGHQSQEKLLAAHPELFITSPQELAERLRGYAKLTS